MKKLRNHHMKEQKMKKYINCTSYTIILISQLPYVIYVVSIITSVQYNRNFLLSCSLIKNEFSLAIIYVQIHKNTHWYSCLCSLRCDAGFQLTPVTDIIVDLFQCIELSQS